MPSPSLRSIAKEMGISAPYLSRMTGGKRPWRADLLEQYNQLVNPVANAETDEELGNRGLKPDLATTGRGPAAGRLVWDQEVGSSNLPAPTKYNLARALVGGFPLKLGV